MGYSSGPETLAKPRILCLHGGGVSARIFRLQARRLVSCLASRFRLVFADGPFWSEMHPDLRPVYSQMGPCRQWAAWSAGTHETLNHDCETVVDAIETSLMATMKADPGSGEWVGVLGFSQGARLAASILLENQIRRDESDINGDGVRQAYEPFTGIDWKFGVLMAGRGPPYALSRRTRGNAFFEPPRRESRSPAGAPEVNGMMPNWAPFPGALQTPTVHVHGLQDEGLQFHRQLLHQYMAPKRACLVEWNGQHRIPVRTIDVEAVAQSILQVAEMAAKNSSGPV